MPNIFAHLMILLWPLIAIFLYKRLGTVTATFWTIVGGYMFLPVKTAIDLPMIPAIGKDEISAISAFIGCYLIKKEKIAFFGRSQLQNNVIYLLLIIPFINVFFNQDPMFNGARWMPGLTIYDATSQVIAQYLELLPFIIAVSIVNKVADLEKITRLLVTAGLIYSILVLFEIRFSPQLHSSIYGFFPHDFRQQMRFGGFRAVVFMGHGLLVATFLFVCLGAAAIQIKIGDQQQKMRNIVIFCYLLLVLVLSKSVGAIVLGIMLAGCILFINNALQKTVAKFIIVLFILYPTLSILDLIPYQGIVDFISSLSVDRAQSLDFRFTNEIAMLEHAYEKVFTGWGSWARNRLDSSVSDGYWLIVYGQYGAIYFYALFGLFIYPVITYFKGAVNRNEKALYSGFALIIAAIVFDQIPNASLSYSWLWFLAGCLSSCELFNRTKTIY